MRFLFLSVFSLSAYSQIDLTRGSVRFNLNYLGQPVSQAARGAHVVMTFGTYATSTGGDVAFVSDVIPGSYTVEVRIGGSSAVAVTAPLTVTGGNQSVVNIELGAVAGVYKGKLLVNGQPGFGYLSCPGSGLGCVGIDPLGNFNHLMPVGNGTGQLSGPAGIIQSFSYTITAGQTVDLGTFNYSTGSVRFDLTYGGQPVSLSARGILAVFSFGAYATSASGDVAFVNDIVPGSYSVEVRVGGSGTVATTLPLTVTGGNQTVVAVELGAVAGVYKGKLLVNGQPGFGYLSCPGTGVGCIGLDPSGNFSHLMPAGNGTGQLSGPSGIIESFSYTIIAGQTVDLGTFNYSNGSVKFNLKYGGQPVSQAARGIQVVLSFGSYATSANGDVAFVFGVVPGSYSVEVRIGGSNSVALTVPLTVTGGNQSVVDVELCGAAGVIRGTLTVNGQPGFGYTSCPSNGIGCIGIDPAGVFTHLMPPGPGTGFILGSSGIAWYYAFKAQACTTVAIGDPTALNVIQSRASVTGTAPNRTWSMKYTNNGAGPAPLNLTHFTLTHLSGPACTPTVQTPLPIPLGTIQPGQFATTPIAINFAGCGALSRFTVKSTVNNGVNPFVLPPFTSFQ